MVERINLTQQVQTLTNQKLQLLMKKRFDLSGVLPGEFGRFIETQNPFAILTSLEKSIPYQSPERHFLTTTLDDFTSTDSKNNSDLFLSLVNYCNSFLNSLVREGTNLLSLHPFNTTIAQTIVSRSFGESPTFQQVPTSIFISQTFHRLWSHLYNCYSSANHLDSHDISVRLSKALSEIHQYESSNWNEFYSLLKPNSRKETKLTTRKNLLEEKRKQITLSLLIELVDFEATIESLKENNEIKRILMDLQSAYFEQATLDNINVLEKYFQNTADLLKLRGFGLTAQRYEELEFQDNLLNSLNEVSQTFAQFPDSWDAIADAVKLQESQRRTYEYINQSGKQNKISLNELSLRQLTDNGEFSELAEYLTATLNHLQIRYPRHSFKFIIHKTDDGEINYEIEYKPNFEEPKKLLLCEVSKDELQSEKQEIEQEMERIVEELEPQTTSRA
jgi:hypothetical protein